MALYREALGMEEKGKTSPGYEQALLAAGEACMEAGDHEGAKVLYEEALRTTGGDGRFESRVRCQMGLYQMAEEDYEGAADSFYQGYDRLITSYKAGTGARLDQAAEAIDILSTVEEEGHIYHLFNPQRLSMKEIGELMIENGVNIKSVSVKEFCEYLNDNMEIYKDLISNITMVTYVREKDIEQLIELCLKCDRTTQILANYGF